MKSPASKSAVRCGKQKRREGNIPIKMKLEAVISLLAAIAISTASFLHYVYADTAPVFSQDNALSDTLDNGLTIIIKEDRRTPTFSASLFVRTGSATEGEFIGSGITHLIEHLIFKGTPSRNALQLENEIKALGGDIGAYTTFDYTAFKMEGPRDNIAPLLEIFYDIIANPQFSNEEFEKEKKVIKREMGLIQDDPQKYLSYQFWQTAYLTHPYRHPIIGYENIFDKLSPEGLKRYYANSYIPDNMVLSIVGDIDKGLVKEKITQTFGRLERRSFSLPVLPAEPQQLISRAKEIPYPISKTYMMIGFHSTSLANRDIYALDTLSILLGEGNSSILYRNLHNKLGMVYSVTAYNYTPFDPGMFIIATTFDAGEKEKVIENIFNNIEKIKTSPLDKKELDKAKNQVISSYIFSKQTQNSQADDLGISQLVTGNMHFSRRYVEGVNSVTAHDIMDVANKYLNKDNMTTVTLTPSVTKTSQSPLQAEAGSPQRTAVKKTLKNGVRLLICQDKTLPLASVRVCIKGGLRAENENNNGISNLTASMLTKGAAGRSEEEIFYSVESLGGALSTYSANNGFGLILDIMSRDVKKGIELIGSILTQPDFPKDKLRILKADTLAQIELANDDIFIVTEKNLREKLFANHPYGMMSLGTVDSINKISRPDIVNFYKYNCVGPNIVISICGDIDPDKVYRLASSKFNGIRKREPPKPKEAAMPPLAERIEVINGMDKKQAVVMAGFRSAGVSNPDKYPLQILSSIFSGGAGRLYANIRQKKGLAYTLGTFGITGIDTGSFVFYAAARGEDINSVKEDIFVQIEDVCKGGVTEEEIGSAKKSLIAKHQIGLQTSGDFALKMALDELYGLGFDNYLLYPDTINKISREEVIQVANRYFTIGNCVVSITSPEKK